jgi:hypothetical protein
MPKLCAPHSLAFSCATVSGVAEQMVSLISSIAAAQERRVQERFHATLSALDRAVLDRQQSIPYDGKDWWRGAHDIFVTRAMAVIVDRENAARRAAGHADLLPQWLVTAAVLHDRGYAILGKCREISGAEYLSRSGAHWEGADTRILHAQLSRRYAARLLFGVKDTELDMIRVGSPLECDVSIEVRELLLEVIETHDYPYVGRYDEMSREARHHFDADSLFSISLLSFVKDYLAYLDDSLKVRAALDIGLGDEGVFTPHGLVVARMSRYFERTDQLPQGWNQVIFPFRTEAVSFVGGRCIRPHSATAQTLTDRAFEDLADCCVVLGQMSSVEEFGGWFSERVKRQFNELLN